MVRKKRRYCRYFIFSCDVGRCSKKEDKRRPLEEIVFVINKNSYIFLHRCQEWLDILCCLFFNEKIMYVMGILLDDSFRQ
jgi:hypothetical protein